jgi:hypothetical protein
LTKRVAAAADAQQIVIASTRPSQEAPAPIPIVEFQSPR